MKPDWKDAPEWAVYVAMDQNGSWFWYSAKPYWIPLDEMWQLMRGSRAELATPPPHGADTLEARPEGV